MRAIAYDAFGPAADVLKLEDMPTPTPGPGEVLVRLKTSGVNPSDVRARAGGRPGITKPPFPKIIPHSDGAGIIEAIGEGVPSSRIGERVWIWNGQWQRAHGTAADYIALPTEQAVPLPESCSFEQGAVLGIPGLTATHAVLAGGAVDGQWILVSGGAGTVGHLAVQIAVANGAQVIATAKGEAGIKAAQAAGATHVFDYADPNLSTHILDATQGAFIDRIIEVEFGQNAQTNSDVIAPGGTIAAYGSAKDMAPTMPFYPLMFKAVTLDLVLVYLLNQTQRSAAIRNLTQLLEQNVLKLRISAELALADCARAHDMIAAGERAGSIVLKI